MTINCAGTNCRHPEENHSPECVAAQAASVAGGCFVKISAPAVDVGAQDDLPTMPSNVAHVMRRIRRCENETAAQVVLEHFAMEYARAALSEKGEAAEPIWCQACGDGITAHDPGICGTCFAVKYRDTSSPSASVPKLTDEQIFEIAREYQTVVPGNCLYILEFARALLAARTTGDKNAD